MYDGTAVLVECRVWDGRRDLALLKIFAIEDARSRLDITSSSTDTPRMEFTFPYLQIKRGELPESSHIFCVGQPGSEDLESSTPKSVKYELFEVSEGQYWGLAPGVDAQCNEDIGGLMHDCWTYWGHSGAPLVDGRGGELVGLHSSWDDDTGMRRGIPGVAVKEFVEENRGAVDGGLEVGASGAVRGEATGSKDDPVVL